MIKRILEYPNHLLQAVSHPVLVFGESVATLARDLTDTCVANAGLGLAAIQVGIPLRVCVVLHQGDYLFMANPVWLACGEPEEELSEGCLSLPGVTGVVSRFPHVKVRYNDLKGERQVIDLRGFAAQTLQHEYDHMQGKLFYEYLDEEHRKALFDVYNRVKS